MGLIQELDGEIPKCVSVLHLFWPEAPVRPEMGSTTRVPVKVI